MSAPLLRLDKELIAPYVDAATAVLREHGYPTDATALRQRLSGVSQSQLKALTEGLEVPEAPPKFVNDCLAILMRVGWLKQAAERGDEATVRWDLLRLGADGARLGFFPLVQAKENQRKASSAGGKKGSASRLDGTKIAREYAITSGMRGVSVQRTLIELRDLAASHDAEHPNTDNPYMNSKTGEHFTAGAIRYWRKIATVK